jgi:hypothetical protein
MAPRVGFEPTTNRLTAGCSTTELPRNIIRPRTSERGLYQVRRQGKSPARHSAQGKRGPLSGPSKALGMVGCLQGKTLVNMMLTGKEPVNWQRPVNEACEIVDV